MNKTLIQEAITDYVNKNSQINLQSSASIEALADHISKFIVDDYNREQEQYNILNNQLEVY